MTARDRLERLASAVLDGLAVDWDAAEGRIEPDARPAIRQLRVVERLARVHRREAATVAEPPADVPSRWGHLEIRAQLGHGAFGTVYRAFDPSLDREVALKLLAPQAQGGDDTSVSVIEEGRLLARIRHPSVVAIHGAARIDGRIGLWMELVPGLTLEALLRRGDRFSAADVVRIGLQVSDAVSAVHDAGLLHRDIKAHNVVRAEDGRVVLMDFGAGREIGDTSQPDLTGTPLYLAPEVLEGGAPTVQSDVYALGVLLYHLLTGAYPVSGRTIREVREAHTAGTRVRLRRARPDVPAALARVIERASDPVAARRYSSARALSADLSAVSRRWPVRRLAAAALCSVVAGAAWTVERGGGDARGPRLAVLIFEGASSEDRTLAKGLTQEVQRNLAGLDGLVLLSFDSASRLPWGRDPVVAGRALDADLVLDGSAVRSGDMLRVHARLVRVADAQVAWNNTYDRRIPDIFAIQDDISRAIADELRVTLRLPRRHDIGLDVYYEFLRAREVQSRRDEYSMRRAAELFEAVVARAPSYAPAWAGIASSLAEEARLRDVPYPPRMKEAAHQAAQLDEFLAEAQQAIGNLFATDGRWRDADTAFRRAMEVDPSLTFIHTEFVLSSLLPQGRLDRALAVLAAAEERDPLSLDVRRVKALVEVEAGRYANAIETAQWVLARDPEFPFASLWLGRALALSGRADEALRHYGQDPATAAYRGYALAVLGRTQEAEQLAASLSAEPHRQMLIYGGLGDTERAFAALERIVAQNRWRAATWMIRPEVARLRNDPRYGVIRDRLGLSDERQHWWRTILTRLHVSN